MSTEKVKTEEAIPQSSLRDLYYVLFRRKWIMVTFFLGVMVITTVGVVLSADHYLSEATLLVRLGRENVTLDPTATTGKILPVRPSHESEMSTELEILNSQDIVEKAVNAIGAETLLYKERPIKGATRKTVRKIKQRFSTVVKKLRNLVRSSPETNGLSSEHDIAVRMVMENLQIRTQKVGSTIDLSYKSQNPKLAQEVLTELINSYLEKRITVHQTPGSHEFFTQQSDHMRESLTVLESKLQNLRNEAGISSIEGQQRVILDHISVLEKDINGAEVALAASTATVQSLQESLSQMSETVVTRVTDGYPNIAADGMRQRLYDLQLQEQDLLSKYETESRPIQDIRQQIAAALALLSKENPERIQQTKELNTTYVQLQSLLLSEQAKMSSLQAQAKELKAKLASTQAELRALNDVEVKTKALTREIEIQEANYRKYSENLEQTRIDDALEAENISNINILQDPTLPVIPVGSRKMITIFLGLVIGMLGGIGLAFFCEYTDHSIKTPMQAEDKLELSTIACIPYVPTFSISRGTRIGEYNEALHLLEEQLLLGHKGSKKIHVLAITGSHRYEGVSMIAANLTTSLARLGQGDVLLIDANLRYPSVHKIFKTKLSPGLTEILSNGNNGDAVICSQAQNLNILSAGRTKQSFSEILNPEKFRKFLTSMKKTYRFIVLDLPAVNEASWTIRLARLCDGVVLVVEAERSRWEVAQNTKEQLLNSKANVLGIVLNKRRYYIPEWLYQTL